MVVSHNSPVAEVANRNRVVSVLVHHKHRRRIGSKRVNRADVNAGCDGEQGGYIGENWMPRLSPSVTQSEGTRTPTASIEQSEVSHVLHAPI